MHFELGFSERSPPVDIRNSRRLLVSRIEITKVRKLLHEQHHTAGEHTVLWDGREVAQLRAAFTSCALKAAIK